MNSGTPPAVHSLWLMPRADDAKALDALIAELAPTFATACFCAHLTVQGDLATPLAELRDIAAALASSCPPLDWPLAAIAGSAHYFRSLFLEQSPNADFARLQSSAAALTRTTDGLSPLPHVSLAYGEPAEPASKPALLQHYAHLPSVMPTLHFDRLVVARSSKSLPIAQWAVLASFALSRSW